jgi:hypothetical protein
VKQRDEKVGAGAKRTGPTVAAVEPRKGLLRSLVLTTAVVSAAVAVIGGGMAGAAARSASSQPCPASPSGWTADRSNPTIFGPVQQPGQHHTMMTCTYTKGKANTVSVIAEYADLNDPNPVSDFDYGCSTKQHEAWDLTHRLYFIENSKNWSYVEFSDPGHQLPNNAAPAFEAVANSLLGNVAHLAHGCELDTTTPTVMQHLYLFGFEFYVTMPNFKAFGGVPARTPDNELIPEGTFAATTAADATVVSKVVSAHAPPFFIHVIDHGKAYKLRARITGGSTFVEQPPTQRLKLALQVTQSKYPSCRSGSRGTLSILRSQNSNSPTAPAYIQLRLCGAVFGNGRFRGTALIISG